MLFGLFAGTSLFFPDSLGIKWGQTGFCSRGSLTDEGDNHVAELAIAGNAAALVTFNLKDFEPAQFAATGMKVLTLAQFKQQYPL
jgi:hypothetical protein